MALSIKSSSLPLTPSTARVAAPLPARNVLAENTAELLSALERLSVNPSAALRLMTVASDPKSSAQDLAKAVAGDPVLTARILQIANSSYYGLSRQVSSPAHAIMVVGFTKVRALAASAAAGVPGRGKPVPGGFWYHAALTASAASLVAPRFGVPRSDAFSLGMLHDLGRGLLHRLAPEVTLQIEVRVEGGECIVDVEREFYGIDHGGAAARVLHAWNLPADFVNAIGSHHLPDLSVPLAATLATAEAIAQRVMPTGDFIEEARCEEAFAAARLIPADVETLSATAAREADGLAPTLSP